MNAIAVARPDEPGSEMQASYEALLARSRERRLKSGAIVGAVVATVLACCWLTGLLDGRRLAEGIPALGQLFGEMMPPDFTRWRDWIRPIVDTLGMSVAGTALAVVLSLPMALLAASNTTPNAVAYRASRLFLNVFRTVPELIMGILFVAAVGFGALPGVLALGLHSIGMVGKFFAEAIEHVDPRPVEAARSAGASPFQVIWHAVLPQVLPQLSDITVYRWEYNFRASTVLGVVGAGGIGFQLISSLRLLDYQQVAAILLCILGCVTLVDGLGALLRRHLK
ncbi:MAG: phosphonate ABC transporter, permease protein PhnE [Tistlia sp.]|uniref:phosphonate ABC transporter, permease protein PhnE n=1 Tax=Tistlia sp. TaxID=3057121 RepID=UPI0034A1E476